jgi:PAS domain S-box-containing protein
MRESEESTNRNDNALAPPATSGVTSQLNSLAVESLRGATGPAGVDTASPPPTIKQAAERSPELRLLYETAPIGLAFLTPDCRYVQINRHLTEICGISIEDHIGRSVRETVPQVAAQVEQIVQLILSKGEPIIGIEVNGQRPDGTNAERFWRTNWHPLRGPEGTIVGINVVAEEITDAKRAEAALAASEARYRALVRASSSLVWTTAADGQIVDMPEWRAFTGQTVDEVRGWGWLNALHPDDRGRTQLVWQAAVNTRSIYETEYRIRRWDGEYVWHQARGVAVFEHDGNIREWVGICVDIEDRKQVAQRQIEAEKALRDLNETLEQRVEVEARERARIWNVSQDLLVVADTEGRFLNVNPAWTATLGWSETDLVGNTSDWLLHPDDREKTRAESSRLGEGLRTLRFENRLRHKGGSYCRLSWTAVPDRGLIYAVARDITELKNAEEQLRTSRRELAEVSRQTTMGAMTASIAHEMNQPLGAIVANANAGMRWLNRAEPKLDEAQASLGRIVRDGLRASEVIASIRSMFRKDRGEKSAVSVNDLVDDVLALAHGELENRRVSLQNEMLHALPQVMADRVQLQQVFLNLITNAVDAMSSVTDRERVLTIKSRTDESDRVLITLEDSGTGIDPGDMDRIFDAFFTTKSDGMGMGLSICRSIIESHGGRLSAAPGHPHGSAFHVVLPTVAARDDS